MAEITIGDEPVDTDFRVWGQELRRKASIAVLAITGLFLVGAVLYYGLDATGSSWFLWTAIVFVVLLLVFEALLIANDVAREQGGPEWLAGPQTATPAPQTETELESEAEGEPTLGGLGTTTQEPADLPSIELKCPECAEVFVTEDDGSRPLETECPHCGAQGHVDLEEPPAHDHDHAHEEEPADDLGGLPDREDEDDEDVEMLSLECPACQTQFDVEDDGTRPLETTCPGCGRSGKLKG